MKKMNLTIAGFILMAGFTACNGDSGTSTTTTTDNTTVSSDSNNAATNNTNNNTTTVNKLPLSTEDSAFVMKAAVGGMMEVEAGNLAQTNALHSRVKAFGMMMVNDHSKANAELMALTSARGITPPTTLPTDLQKHMDDMKKMKEKAFDKHYMDMMVNDHQKTIADFEKQANSGTDPDIKAFAAKTLPTLKMHRDSAVAINKIKM